MNTELTTEECRELDKDAAEFFLNAQTEYGGFGRWAIDSTGMAMPKTMAQFGAEWYKKKVIEKNKNHYYCDTCFFGEDDSGSYFSDRLTRYIEETYNREDIEVVDMKITYEKRHIDQPGQYRVFFIYKNI